MLNITYPTNNPQTIFLSLNNFINCLRKTSKDEFCQEITPYPYMSLSLPTESEIFIKTEMHIGDDLGDNQMYPSGVSPIASSTQSSPTNQQPIRKKPKRRRIITPEQRTAANVRERKRMFSMNDGFDELRKHLPKFSYENKLSRIETLRLAIIYIQYMTDIVKHNKSPADATVRSLKHGWPSSKPRYQFPSFLPSHLYPGYGMIHSACETDYFNQSLAMVPMEIH